MRILVAVAAVASSVGHVAVVVSDVVVVAAAAVDTHVVGVVSDDGGTHSVDAVAADLAEVDQVDDAHTHTAAAAAAGLVEHTHDTVVVEAAVDTNTQYTEPVAVVVGVEAVDHNNPRIPVVALAAAEADTPHTNHTSVAVVAVAVAVVAVAAPEHTPVVAAAVANHIHHHNLAAPAAGSEVVVAVVVGHSMKMGQHPFVHSYLCYLRSLQKRYKEVRNVEVLQEAGRTLRA